MKQKQQSKSSTAKSDGQKPTENLSLCSIVDSYRAGMCQKYVQLEQHLKHLEEELVALNPLSNYSVSQLMSLNGRLVESSAALNAMISAAKSLRSWLSEGLDEARSSA